MKDRGNCDRCGEHCDYCTPTNALAAPAAEPGAALEAALEATAAALIGWDWTCIDETRRKQIITDAKNDGREAYAEALAGAPGRAAPTDTRMADFKQAILAATGYADPVVGRMLSEDQIIERIARLFAVALRAGDAPPGGQP